MSLRFSLRVVHMGWWVEWHWCRSSSEQFGFPLPITILPVLYRHIIQGCCFNVLKFAVPSELVWPHCYKQCNHFLYTIYNVCAYSKYETTWGVANKGAVTIVLSSRSAPRDGAYVHGLFMEGARWDIQHGSIMESKLKELFPIMPVVNIRVSGHTMEILFLLCVFFCRDVCGTFGQTLMNWKIANLSLWQCG